MDLFLACVSVVAGLVFGSFLNVCVTRIPRDESIVSPGSHCPRCGGSISWYHNIPVLSFVMLRGRCAHCKGRIPFRYLIVELLTAALFFGCFLKFGPSLALLKFAVFSFLLIALIFIDAETGLLPAEFTYPGIAIGFLFAWLVPGDTAGTEFLLGVFGFDPAFGARLLSLLDAVMAAAFGAAFFYCIWALFYLVRKRHGLGFGDIALIAMCGAFLGLKLTVFVLFAAPLSGAVYAITLLATSALRPANARSTSPQSHVTTREMLRTREIPFGVFLGSCALLAVFWGERAWDLYLAWAKLS